MGKAGCRKEGVKKKEGVRKNWGKGGDAEVRERLQG